MSVYNPTDANFLTVAQTRTNNGQKDVRVILDISTNIFYTLDDDGNFIEIQSSGGGQDLAGTLQIGNETLGTPISISKGDYIIGDDGWDLTLKQENSVDGQSGGLILDCNTNYFTSTLYSKDDVSGDTMKVVCDLGEALFISPNGSVLGLSDLGGFNFNRAWTNVLFSSTQGMNFGVSKTERAYGSITEFKTTGNASTLLVKTPGVGGPISFIEVVVKAYYTEPSPGTIRKGLVKKMSAAAAKNASFQLVQIGTTEVDFFRSDFSTADASITPNGSFYEVNVTGETATDIYWNAAITLHYL